MTPYNLIISYLRKLSIKVIFVITVKGRTVKKSNFKTYNQEMYRFYSLLYKISTLKILKDVKFRHKHKWTDTHHLLSTNGKVRLSGYTWVWYHFSVWNKKTNKLSIKKLVRKDRDIKRNKKRTCISYVWWEIINALHILIYNYISTII